MRGGAIAFIVWAILNALLLGTDWFWTHDGLDTGLTLFTVTTVLFWAIALAVMNRDSLRKGPPDFDERPQAIATASFGAVMFAVAIVCVVFAFEFGHFLYYFGIGLAIFAVGVLLRERYNQRRALRRWLRRDE